MFEMSNTSVTFAFGYIIFSTVNMAWVCFNEWDCEIWEDAKQSRTMEEKPVEPCQQAFINCTPMNNYLAIWSMKPEQKQTQGWIEFAKIEWIKFECYSIF